MSAVKEALVRIRDFFKENEWTQDADARNSAGCIVDYDNPHATSWCLLGAMDYLLGKGHEGETWMLPLHIEGHLNKHTGKSIVEWNDYPGRTREEVIDMLNKAIEEA